MCPLGEQGLAWGVDEEGFMVTGTTIGNPDPLSGGCGPGDRLQKGSFIRLSVRGTRVLSSTSE